MIHIAEAADQRIIWRAIIFSLLLHALVMLVYPRLRPNMTVTMPERLAVELLSVTSRPQAQAELPRPTATPVNEAQAVPLTKPVAARQSRVLTSTEPSSATDYRLPEPPSPNETVSQAEPVQREISAQAAGVSSELKDSKQTAANAATSAAVTSTPAQTATAKPAEEEFVSDDDAWQGYGQALHAMVSKSKKYPAIAVRRHWEGDARIVARFVRGELVEVQVLEASGHVPLDEEAVRMVKQAIAQLGIRDSLARKTFKVTIPVSFKLE